MSTNISHEPEEFDDEARALADAIQATPEDPYVDDAATSLSPVPKKKSSLFMKLIIGLGSVFVLAMGGAYYYTNMMVPVPVVKKPAMPKLSDEVVVKSDVSALPVQNAAPVQEASSTAPSTQVTAPVTADPFAAKEAKSPVPVVAELKVETPAIKEVPVKESPKEVAVTKSATKSHKLVSSKPSKKDDTGYVQLF